MRPSEPYHHYGEYSREPSGLKRLDFMASQIHREAEGKGRRLSILEVGCGNGNIVISMGSLGDHEILGIDIDAESIEKAVRANPFGNVKFLCGDLEGLALPGNFDVVICSEVLEHLESPAWMLRKIRSLLVQDGLILMTIPNGYGPLEVKQRVLLRIRSQLVKIKIGNWLISLYRRMRNFDHENIQTSNVNREGDKHLQFFTLSAFQSLLKQEDITVLSIRNSNCWLGFGVLWYLALQRLIRRGSPVFHFLDWIDCQAADALPHALAAGWYFSGRKVP